LISFLAKLICFDSLSIYVAAIPMIVRGEVMEKTEGTFFSALDFMLAFIIVLYSYSMSYLMDLI